MKLSEVPEFKPIAQAQENDKEKETLVQEIQELRKEIKDVKLLLTSLLMQKGSK